MLKCLNILIKQIYSLQKILIKKNKYLLEKRKKLLTEISENNNLTD